MRMISSNATVLGVDIGTSALKAILIDEQGHVIASASMDYPIIAGDKGTAEQDPERVWRALVGAVHQISQATGGKRNPVAIALASQSGSLIALDSAGNPIVPMILWMDERTADLTDQWLSQDHGATVRSISGWHLYPGLPLIQIAWLRLFRPDIFTVLTHFMGINDYLTYRLTGQRITDSSSAGAMGLRDIHQGMWSSELCGLAGITKQQLSQVTESGTNEGTILPEICEELGLSHSTSIIAGGHDQSCAALALGIIQPGDVLLATGTAWILAVVAEDMKIIPRSMDINHHLVYDRKVASQLLGNYGALLDLTIRQICLQENIVMNSRDRRYDKVNQWLQESEPGCHGLFYDPHSADQHFHGLEQAHSYGDRLRAVMESAAFETRRALDQLRSSGCKPQSIYMIGGAVKSPVWVRLVADILGMDLKVSHHTSLPAVGAAILAGVGIGLFDTVEAGITRFEETITTVYATEVHTAIYAERYTQYQRLIQEVEGSP